jgi:hypothetical protein
MCGDTVIEHKLSVGGWLVFTIFGEDKSCVHQTSNGMLIASVTFSCNNSPFFRTYYRRATVLGSGFVAYKRIADFTDAVARRNTRMYLYKIG